MNINRFGIQVGIALGAVAIAVVGAVRVDAAPAINAPYTTNLSVNLASTGNVGMIAQMAFGPDGRVYASRYNASAVRFDYNPTTGALSNMQTSASSVQGLGVAFHGNTMYQTEQSTGSIYRLTDNNGNGNWGETGLGETRVAIVTNLPHGDHDVDQLRVIGNSLYVGVGTRTTNGSFGVNSGMDTNDFGGSGMRTGGNGNTWGESAYGGSISWIENLNAVSSTTNAASLYTTANQTNIQTNATPFTSTDPSKLRIHSSGARNPYGLTVDQNNELFFTNNYNRANVTGGNGTADKGLYADALDSNLADAPHDQFFKATADADYGFRNDNWRGVRDAGVIADILNPSDPDYNRVRSITPDGLWSTDPNYLTLHNPAAPVGLGPSSSANGVDFWNSPFLPASLNGRAFIARWTASVTEAGPGTDTLTYKDLVAVDPATGNVVRVATGFNNPLAVLRTPDGRLLVSDFSFGSSNAVYVLTPIPEPSTLALLALGGVLGVPAAGRYLRRRRVR
ncbi:MAG: PEP-CTERM sorting domain-containing protein [Planctomycetota bacterium]|nr:PEP-CTERM sorting domain-containing protein [Planctomycetota bacterium]